MKLSEIRELINLVDKSGLTEFEYECSDGDRLVMRKRVSSASAEPPNAVDPAGTEVAARPESEPGLAASVSQDEFPATGEFVITAPMVGTFYRAPSPDAEPFVEVGDIVTRTDGLYSRGHEAHERDRSRASRQDREDSR